MAMNIESFDSLSNFMYNEFEKIRDSFSIEVASGSLVKFMEKSLKKYYKLYDKPLYKLERRQMKKFIKDSKKKIKLEIKQSDFDRKVSYALLKMPVSDFWKKMHPKLWYEMQKRISESKNDDFVDNKPEVCYPAIYSPREVQPITENGSF